MLYLTKDQKSRTGRLNSQAWLWFINKPAADTSIVTAGDSEETSGIFRGLHWMDPASCAWMSKNSTRRACAKPEGFSIFLDGPWMIKFGTVEYSFKRTVARLVWLCHWLKKCFTVSLSSVEKLVVYSDDISGRLPQRLTRNENTISLDSLLVESGFQSMLGLKAWQALRSCTPDQNRKQCISNVTVLLLWK